MKDKEKESKKMNVYEIAGKTGRVMKNGSKIILPAIAYTYIFLNKVMDVKNNKNL